MTYYNDTGWHYFTHVIDNATTSQFMYVDGQLIGSTSFLSAICWDRLKHAGVSLAGRTYV